MTGSLIPFPETPAPSSAAGGDEVAEARLLLRAGPGRITAGMQDRCLDAVLRAFAGATQLRDSGPPEARVIEASYRGTGCAVWAAQSVQHAASEVQRIGAGRFLPSGAVAEGHEVLEAGVAVRVGDPVGVADRLILRAAPGQILVAGEGWRARRGMALLPATGTTDHAAVAVWVLREG